MIQFKTQAYLDLKKYDRCIQMDPLHLPYAHSWFLNSAAEQWDCLVLNDYDAVWPLPFRRKLGLKYYYRPFGIQQLGIYSKKPLSEEQLMAFFVALEGQVAFADIYLNEGQFLTNLSSNKFKLNKLPNYVLELNRSYEQVYDGFNTNLKRKLKKVESSKLQLFESDSAELILDLFRTEKGKQLKLGADFFLGMKKVLYKLMHKGLVKVYSVYGGPNQLIAGAVFIEYQGRSIFFLSANTEMGRDYNAMAYLINEYLIFNSESFDSLDFEGSKNSGLARFYQSFGAVDHAYGHLTLNRLPWPLSLMKR